MKKMRKDIMDMTRSGLMIGAGSQVLGSMGVSGLGGSLGGFTTFMPAMANVSGASTAIRMTRKLKPRR